MVYTYFNGPRRITKARDLRKNQTVEENILWQKLRKNQLSGYKFRRQQIINEMIVDFFCASNKLIIELDGPYHLDPVQKIKDSQRDKTLSDLGFLVIRFTNHQINNDLENVLSQILHNLENK